MENISAHISYKEGVVSATGGRLGIKNDPPPEILHTMHVTALKLFEPIRTSWNAPLRILSFFRCPALNKAVGGAKSSQHMIGEAIDVDAMTGTNAQLFHHIVKTGVDFDQIICEFPVNGEPQWLHISYTEKRKNRREILVAVKLRGKTVYLPYKGNEHYVS